MAIVGIDLGTTNSLISHFRDGQPHLIPNALGETLTPSVVSVDKTGSILVGRAARERLITHPNDTAAQFKRSMGSRKIFNLRGMKFLPEELSALVLRALKEDAEALLGEKVEEAVISVPAYFNDAQRKATRAAGLLAGLKVERLINEPTAAAIAYGLPNIDKESTFLVFDLGGGTFDVSILELFDGTMEVHAASGDNYLGGEDFDMAIADAFLSEHKIDREKLDAKTEAKLKSRAEQLKVLLSREKSGVMNLEHKGKSLEWTLDRDGFENVSKSLLQRIRIPVEKALRDSRLKTSDLDSVILVGGSTRIPFVRNLVARLFGRIPATHLNPDEVIALGAGIASAMKARNEDLKEVVMTDVCPYTMGMGIARQLNDGIFQPGHYLPVIERNSTVPVSRSEIVNPIRMNQTELEVEVYQGESRLVSNNVRLGMIRVPLPKAPIEELSVEIRFTYDINGLLEVEATVLKTGHKVAVVIEENPGVLSKEEIQSRFLNLSMLKIHPRDQAENRALTAKAERMYEESLGSLRDYIGAEISIFAHAVDRQNLSTITEARTRLSTALGKAEEEGRLP
jgi:molecular chaperone HscC